MGSGLRDDVDPARMGSGLRARDTVGRRRRVPRGPWGWFVYVLAAGYFLE